MQCCLPLVTFFDAREVVSVSNVYLNDNLCQSDAGECLVDQGKRITIFDSALVKALVVQEGSEGTFLFLDKENGGGCRG